MSKLAAPVVLLLLILTIVTLSAFAIYSSDSAAPLDLIQILSAARPSSGRLFLAPAITPSENDYRAAMNKAQIVMLTLRDGRRLQALLAIGRGDMESAAKILADLSRSHPGNAQILNDLAVIYMALGNQRPAHYLNAIQALELSRRLDPTARAPRYNLVLAYRKAGLVALAKQRQDQYERIEEDLVWKHLLDEREEEANDDQLKIELARAIANGDESAAASLFESNVEIYRRLATDEAFTTGSGDPSPVLRFTAQRLMVDYHDATLTAMVAGLDSPFRSRIMNSRRLVQAGNASYFKNNYQDSLRMYDQAAAEISGIPAKFDGLWIELNRANAEIRMGCKTCSQSAESRLDHVLLVSNEAQLRWMRGQALTARGSDSSFTPGYDQLIQTLFQAVDELTEIGARNDTVRAVNYLATAYYAANDFEHSFQFAHQARLRTQSSDHVRLSQLYLLEGKTSYRLGCIACAVGFEKQALSEAKATGNPAREISALSSLATLYETIGQHDLAKNSLNEIQKAIQQFPASRDRDMLDLSANLLCSGIRFAESNLNGANTCLQTNLAILKRQPQIIPDYFSATLLQLARIYVRWNRIDEARETFRQAAAVIESNDAYFAIPNLRSTFENERRNLYEASITFEADHCGLDAAWTYLQRYRSKLFLEFLGQMNPKANEIHSEAMQRNQVQKRIPKDVQVMEYVMLPDRLLIWLVSNDGFASKSVAVPRAELQSTISGFLDAIQNRGDVQQPSKQLYKLLISPFEKELDFHRAIAVVPDQDLHRLPFSALLNPLTGHYLVQDFDLLESPSLTQLLLPPVRPRRTNAVAFGTLTGDLSSMGELSVLKTAYPSEMTYTGTAVSKHEFLSAMASADVLHYSGHSVDAADPLRSSLLLDGNFEGPNSISALDISRQHMRPSSLVVLASCDSSVGNSRDGVGMRGLTSAFLISGAGAVVGSLWLVETASTSRLMSDFHRRFATGTPSAQALRQSQIAFIHSGARSRHPYYWSGFVVTGNTSSLE